MSQAGVWTLDSAVEQEEMESMESIVSHVRVSREHGGVRTQESIIDGVDRRIRAVKGDFMDNGRYRCKGSSTVVKIFTRFDDVKKGTSMWMMGTGWLVRPDLLVTAGHVVYDWNKGLGESQEIRCYIGYNGRASIGEPYVQSRSATKIVTTAEWLSDKVDRTRTKDVNHPFEGNLSLFKYTINTPIAVSKVILGVVGYPGDKYLTNDETGEEETGAEIPRNMIEYRISTYGGRSGAPIIRRTDINSGNSIGGQYGNVCSKYIDLFSQPLNVPKGKATIVKVDYASNANGQGPNGRAPDGLVPTNNRAGSDVSDAEGIFDILRAIGKVGSVALPIAGSILGGPIGGGIATVAGSLLGMVSGAESALDHGTSSAESFTPDSLAHGATERAVLAEAALRTILSLDRGDVAEALIDDVVSNCERTAPKLEGLVKVFRPVLTQQALKIAIRDMNRTGGLAQTSAESAVSRNRVNIHTGDLPENALTGEGAALLECLLTPTVPVAGEEGWISGLGSLISTRLKWAAPIAGNLAKEYAPKIIGGIVSKITSGPEGVEGSDKLLNDDTTRFLLKRALLADASLTALQRLNKSELSQLRIREEIWQEHALGDEEGGWGDFFKGVVQKVAPIGLQGAKKAAAALVPKIMDVALSKLGVNESKLNVPDGGRTIKTKRSFYDVLSGSSPIQAKAKTAVR
ncbi:hypothetical protein LZ30DRAFT_764640 [Colletotrichum cereale]|nr:hypothetical protein LZ30DRAFT_764640 [Colletotrichum cereale]